MAVGLPPVGLPLMPVPFLRSLVRQPGKGTLLEQHIYEVRKELDVDSALPQPQDITGQDTSTKMVSGGVVFHLRVWKLPGKGTDGKCTLQKVIVERASKALDGNEFIHNMEIAVSAQHGTTTSFQQTRTKISTFEIGIEHPATTTKVAEFPLSLDKFMLDTGFGGDTGGMLGTSFHGLTIPPTVRPMLPPMSFMALDDVEDPLTRVGGIETWVPSTANSHTRTLGTLGEDIEGGSVSSMDIEELAADIRAFL